MPRLPGLCRIHCEGQGVKAFTGFTGLEIGPALCLVVYQHSSDGFRLWTLGFGLWIGNAVTVGGENPDVHHVRLRGIHKASA